MIAGKDTRIDGLSVPPVLMQGQPRCIDRPPLRYDAVIPTEGVKFIFYAIHPTLPGKTAFSGISISGDVWDVSKEAMFE